jgi:signal transduction histidine kinase
MVDTDRIWFKSHYGMDKKQVDRDSGLCSSAILSDDIYVVTDALNDKRTLANPLVAGEFGLQFYAAVPIKVRGNFNLGTLCVIDRHPREISDGEKLILENLTAVLIDQLELRLEARKAVSRQNQLLHIAAHDMKSPLTIIPLWSDLIQKEKNNSEKIDLMCSKIKEASSTMLHVVDDLLEAASRESVEVPLNLQKINLTKHIESLVLVSQIIADKKNQSLRYIGNERVYVFADAEKLTIIADNLISNAIKYSLPNQEILVTVKAEKNKALLQVKDEGLGFTSDEKKMLFQRFSRLDNKPTDGEKSVGLGLSIAKDIAEAHNGKIIAESEGKNKGSTFTVQLPLFRKLYME